MKTETKVVILSALLGVAIWIADSAVDSLFFSHEPFLKALLHEPKPYAIYVRTMVFLTVVALGVAAASLLRRERAVEKRLQESEERFEAFMDRLPGFAFIRDREGRFVFVNRVMAEILGKPASHILGRRALGLLRPEVAQSSMEEDKTILATGRPFRGEDLIRHPGGSRHWMVSKFPILDERGEVALVGGISIDITERKAAEKALRESEERYRTLVENLGEGVSIMDQEETFLFANPAGEAIFGVPPGSLAGRNLREFLSDEELAKAKEGTRLRRQGVTSTFEYCIVRPDGSQRIVLVTATPKRDAAGEYVATQGVFSDITEARRAETALRESEARYRLLFERNLAGVYRSTIEGRMLECNTACARILGCSSPQEAALCNTTQSYDDPEDRKRFIEALQRNGTVTNWEVILKRRDGSTFPALLNAALVQNADGSGHIEGTMLDISERKRLEAEKARAMDLETVAKLAAGVAHEVRNPLFAIQLNLAALARRLSPGPEARTHMEHIQAHAKRLDVLARSLLELGRAVEADELVEVDLRTLVRTACIAIGDESPEVRDRIVMEDCPRPVIVRGARQSIVQAFVHLLRNAAQATPEGGTIRIACAHEAGAHAVRISDEGPGIPEPIREKLFDPFFTTRTGQPGMGLALAKHYVETLGGTIAAENNDPPPGATFTVTLPAVEPSKKGEDSPGSEK